MDGWNDCESLFSNVENYLFVFVVAVKRQFQGQGFFRCMMEQVFKKADSLNFPCILDTDSERKANKYRAIGMKERQSAMLSNGEHMFTFSYEP